MSDGLSTDGTWFRSLTQPITSGQTGDGRTGMDVVSPGEVPALPGGGGESVGTNPFRIGAGVDVTGPPGPGSDTQGATQVIVGTSCCC